MKKRFFIRVLLSGAILASCTKNSVTNSMNNNNSSGTPACTGTKSFANDVNPVIQSVCAASGCHDAASTNGPGPLTSFQQVFNARVNIRSAVVSGLMPKNSTLSATQKSAIICWIDNGALNN